MDKRKNRKHSIIDGLPDSLRDTVKQMLLSGCFYSDVVKFLGENGVSLSISSVQRYATSFHASVEAMQIANANFSYMMAEVERMPDLDTTEVLTRIASQQLLDALVSRSPEEWDSVGMEKIVSQISGLTHAIAYKKRVEIQNKDKLSAATDGLRNEMFVVLAREEPELYGKVNQFLKRKARESAQ